MKVFIINIEDKPNIIEEWDDKLWTLLVEKAIVHHDKSITFEFINKRKVTIEAE